MSTSRRYNNVIIVYSKYNITTNALLEPKLVLSKHVTLTKSKQVHVIKYNNDITMIILVKCTACGQVTQNQIKCESLTIELNVSVSKQCV